MLQHSIRTCLWAYISQLVCIGRLCSDYSSFALRYLTERLVHLGFRYSNLKKIARRHGQILDKYGFGVQRHIDDGICLPVMDIVSYTGITRMRIWYAPIGMNGGGCGTHFVSCICPCSVFVVETLGL